MVASIAKPRSARIPGLLLIYMPIEGVWFDPTLLIGPPLFTLWGFGCPRFGKDRSLPE